MIKITVIAIGKIKEQGFLLALDEYEKRLGAFCELKTIEIKPHPLPQDPSDSQVETALKEEAEKIIERIPKGAYVFPLCIEGKRLSSEDFAEKIHLLLNEGQNICFIIGGSHGLDKSIKKSGTGLSFSEMTFPHRLFRVMLLEQIYRAFTIISGKKYHK